MSLAALRRAEDAFVDELFAAAPALGMPLLAARFPRSYVDANREPYELDPGMFEGPLPRPLNHRTTRVAAGLGMIPRVAASGEAIYRGRVPSDEIEQRLETCWRPYHTALSTLVEQTHRPVRQRASDRRPFHAVLGVGHRACASATIASTSCWATIMASPAPPIWSTAPSAGSPAAGLQGSAQPALCRRLQHAALRIGPALAGTPCRSKSIAPLYMDEARHEKLPTAGVVARLMAGLLEEIGDQARTVLLPRPLAAE